jgi:hypothetical protein
LIFRIFPLNETYVCLSQNVGGGSAFGAREFLFPVKRAYGKRSEGSDSPVARKLQGIERKTDGRIPGKYAEIKRRESRESSSERRQ